MIWQASKIVFAIVVLLLTSAVAYEMSSTFSVNSPTVAEPKIDILIFGIVFMTLTVVFIWVVLKRTNREIEGKIESGFLSHLMFIFFGFMTVLCFWYSIGLFPTAYARSQRQWEVILDKELFNPFRDVSETAKKSDDSSGEPVVGDSSKTMSQSKNQSGEIVPKISEEMNAGIFGDQFGGVNSLFSGLAFLGVLAAVIFQILEMKYQRAELEVTKKGVRDSYQLQLFQVLYESLDVDDENEKEVKDGLKLQILGTRSFLDLDGPLRESGRLQIAHDLKQMKRDQLWAKLLMAIDKKDKEEFNNNVIALLKRTTSIMGRYIAGPMLEDLFDKISKMLLVINLGSGDSDEKKWIDAKAAFADAYKMFTKIGDGSV